MHAPGGIRTHDLGRRAAAELRLRPRGYWDRQVKYYIVKLFIVECSRLIEIKNYRFLKMFTRTFLFVLM